MRRNLSSILVLILLPLAALAQSNGVDSDLGDPGLGGKNSIQGRIYYPSGAPFDRRIRVKVNSVRGGPTSVSTDDNGMFVIPRLTDGTYDLTVNAGSAFEVSNETVRIIDNGVRKGEGQTIFVQITLKPQSSTASHPAGVVNAALAGIPKPAQELYQQALDSSKAGDHKKAVEELKKALGIAPDFMPALNELGMQYLRLNEPDKAAASLEQ